MCWQMENNLPITERCYQFAGMLVHLSLCSPRESCSPPPKHRSWLQPVSTHRGDTKRKASGRHCRPVCLLLDIAVLSTVGQASASTAGPASTNLFKPVNSFPLHQVHSLCETVYKSAKGKRQMSVRC